MQKSWSRCHKFRAFCWSEYSVAWSYTSGQGQIPGSPTGTTALSCMQAIIFSFRFSRTNCFRYWYWVATYREFRWCNHAIRDCTLTLTLKRPVNLWAVFTWAFIGWNSNLRDSTLGIQPGVNCHPHFYRVKYSKPRKKKILEGVDGFVDCWRDTSGHFLKKFILQLLLKTGAAILFTLISKQENYSGGESIDLTINLVLPDRWMCPFTYHHSRLQVTTVSTTYTTVL